MPYEFDTETATFLDTDTGRHVGENRIRALVNRYQGQKESSVQELAISMRDGNLTLQQWVSRMRDQIRDSYIVSYLAGRGGRGQMGQEDWGRIGGLLRSQYAYLNRFGLDIASGNMSVDQIIARANLYIHSSTQAYERAKVAANGIPSLPAYPGDGSSECGANDRCRWVIKQFPDRIEATWTLTPAEHCPTCLNRASIWNPLILRRR